MLGIKIRELRIEKNIKQVELAKLAGISNTYLSDIEKGRTLPSLKTLYKLASALNVDVDIFLDTNYVNYEQIFNQDSA